jgi:hypothetical protein
MVDRPRQVILSPLVITSKDNQPINRNKVSSQIMGLPKEEIGNVRRRVTPIRIGAQTEEYGAIILPTPPKVI